jgi:hypothetical protein
MTEFEIPEHLQHRPILGGLVVPYITAQRPEDGMFVFGAIDGQRQRLCLIKRWCQICGRPIEKPPYVFLLRPYEKFVLPNLETFELVTVARTAEPPLHPDCVPYSARACPMLSGRKTHYRSTPAPIGEYAEHPADTDNRLGHAAEPWLSLEAEAYSVEITSDNVAYAMVHQRGDGTKPLHQAEPDKNT